MLRGKMSLVGPRPLLMDYLDHYTSWQVHRHEVKPGITGGAQGRNAVSWPERFELNLWYVEHQRFWLDVKILVGTAWQVLTRQGINSHDHATMLRFRGPEGHS